MGDTFSSDAFGIRGNQYSSLGGKREGRQKYGSLPAWGKRKDRSFDEGGTETENNLANDKKQAEN